MMKKTKKCVALAMASLLMLFAVSCQGEGASSSPAPSAAVSSAQPASSEPASQTPEVEQTTIRIAALNGPTGIGMEKLLDDS